MDAPHENLTNDHPAASHLCPSRATRSARRVGGDVGHPRAVLRSVLVYVWASHAGFSPWVVF
jgi:hypothetical protein